MVNVYNFSNETKTCADVIRGYSDEELALYLASIVTENYDRGANLYQEWLKWLKTELEPDRINEFSPSENDKKR